MSDETEKLLRQQLAQLRADHRKLDDQIDEIEQSNVKDQLAITRLKKQKLALKDKIASLEDRLFPDIIA